MSVIERILIVFLFLSLFACEAQKSEEEHVKLKKIVIDVDNCYDNRLSDWFEIEKIIPLETTPQSLIKRISTVHFSNKEILVYENSQHNLFRFKINGEFLNKVGVFGKGPDEYLKINDYFTDSNHDTIAIYDGQRQSVLFYNRDNEVFDKKKVESYFASFSVWKNQQLLLYGRYTSRFPQGSKISNFCTYNFDGKLLYEDIFYNHDQLTQTSYKKYNNLYPLKDGSINVQKYFNDTIYIYNGQKLKPRLYLDLGKYKISYEEKQDYLEKSNQDYRKFDKLLAHKRYFVNSQSIWLESDNFIYTNRRSTKSAIIHIAIDKKTNDVLVNNYMSQVLVWKALTLPVGVAELEEDTYLVFALRSTSLHMFNKKFKKEFADFKSNYPKEAKLFEEKLETVNVEDNPCLVLAKYKKNE